MEKTKYQETESASGRNERNDGLSGRLLKSIRETIGLSERAVCYGLCGERTYQRIESGEREPDRFMLEIFLERMGFLIESPVYYPDMSAAQNLAIQGSIKGARDKAHIQELLELTGLQGAGWKRLKDFSTGMKQRYGIAFALLGWPEVLILDELLNGMDVPNMDAVTEVLRKLNEERGITILLSSHLLERLYSLATDYIFLDQGVILQTASKEELDRQIPKEGIEEYFRRLVSGKVSGRA